MRLDTLSAAGYGAEMTRREQGEQLAPDRCGQPDEFDAGESALLETQQRAALAREQHTGELTEVGLVTDHRNGGAVGVELEAVKKPVEITAGGQVVHDLYAV